MAQYQVADIRTVALVGHEVTGKTSLADALLYKAKANDRRGSPDDGTSVSDFDEEEKKHKYSIDSSVLHADYQGTDIDPWGNERVGLEVTGQLNRSEWDMKFNQMLGSGNMMVSDKVKLVLDVSAVKAA